LARCLAILEALRTFGIEAQHPIPDGLQPDAADARRIAAREPPSKISASASRRRAKAASLLCLARARS
jgi:hypothetical protein